MGHIQQLRQEMQMQDGRVTSVVPFPHRLSLLSVPAQSSIDAGGKLVTATITRSTLSMHIQLRSPGRLVQGLLPQMPLHLRGLSQEDEHRPEHLARQDGHKGHQAGYVHSDLGDQHPAKTSTKIPKARRSCSTMPRDSRHQSQSSVQRHSMHASCVGHRSQDGHTQRMVFPIGARVRNVPAGETRRAHICYLQTVAAAGCSRNQRQRIHPRGLGSTLRPIND